MHVTRGFKGKRRTDATDRARLPPGQYLTPEFPVLTAGPTIHTPLDRWKLALQNGGSLVATWTWAEFEALPQTDLQTDIHCVTQWSKFDTRWRGVTIDDIFRAADLAVPPTGYLMAHCDGGYTTNLLVSDLIDGRAMIATHYDGLPLLPSHGGPARLLLPHLYFWKSAKWVRRLAFRDKDDPGFWESRGYHLRGDPWREQRYHGDP
ncbi:molybdopterin-dependent oxidoreductase [Rhodopseudomonas sp. B29]|uniref:molybdopterin-dependent oxidoreductase n=1 Tax=Rhodopseudomonas sp. B29 TaxID=95607 RepID=UPI00034C4248|nr:molybdopterin-dependent oxidoreductase [Rhodopseudomonas sp. B29]